jgi:isopenicillin N synthase-like dioxygenase
LDLSFTDSLSRYHAGSLFTLSLLHYPAVSTQLLRSGTLARIPAHSDPGTLTLLFQDDVGGLEIAELGSATTDTSAGFEKSGRFRHVEPKPGTVVVNVGYLLMRLSNGRWKNTVHRVLEPPSPLKGQVLDEPNVPKTHGMNDGSADDITPARYSIPFFAVPDPATIVEALPGCWSEEVPKRWKPISAGDYLRKKSKAMYT